MRLKSSAATRIDEDARRLMIRKMRDAPPNLGRSTSLWCPIVAAIVTLIRVGTAPVLIPTLRIRSCNVHSKNSTYDASIVDRSSPLKNDARCQLWIAQKHLEHRHPNIY
jgi:hypothetical protein